MHLRSPHTLLAALLTLSACSDPRLPACDGGGCQPDGGSGETGGGAGGSGGAGGGDTGESDAGPADAGPADAGSTLDAGCGGAAQLAFVSAEQTLSPNACSSPVRLQLQDRCGAPVVTAAALPVTLSSGGADFFRDATCGIQPSSWAIAAGSSELGFFLLAGPPGTTSIEARAMGVDAGTQTVNIVCGPDERVCRGGCLLNSSCCEDADCAMGDLMWVCNASSQCEPPPCTGFPAGCTTFDDRTATSANRTVTFGSSGYSPKCMRVSSSQDVTFSGSFFQHPLQQTCGPSNRNLGTTSGTSKTFRFPSFGTYGYRCANHPVFEQGAIRVP